MFATPLSFAQAAVVDCVHVYYHVDSLPTMLFGRCCSELACSSLEFVGVHCSSPLHEAKTLSLKNSYCRKLWLICFHLNSKHEGLLEFLLCCVHHALVLLFNAIPENLFSEVDEAQKPR